MERQGTDGGRHIQRLQLTGTEEPTRERERHRERESAQETETKKQKLHFLPKVVVITLHQIACRVEEQQHYLMFFFGFTSTSHELLSKWPGLIQITVLRYYSKSFYKLEVVKVELLL